MTRCRCALRVFRTALFWKEKYFECSAMSFDFLCTGSWEWWR